MTTNERVHYTNVNVTDWKRDRIENPYPAANHTRLPRNLQRELRSLQALTQSYRTPNGFCARSSRFWASESLRKGQTLVRLSDGQRYQAGEGLERQHNNPFMGTKIVVVKHRVCKTKRLKYAVCQIVQKGDWLNLVDYDKAPLLPHRNKRYEVSVLDVRTVSHRGQKRKLIRETNPRWRWCRVQN